MFCNLRRVVQVSKQQGSFQGQQSPEGQLSCRYSLFFTFSFIFHFVFFFYRGNISSRPQRASWPARNHCFRAKLLLDQSDSWHSDLRCYQTNMVIGHELILSSSVFLGRTSCLITHSVWSFDYHFQSTAVNASLQIGRALLLLCKHLSENLFWVRGKKNLWIRMSKKDFCWNLVIP